MNKIRSHADKSSITKFTSYILFLNCVTIYISRPIVLPTYIQYIAEYTQITLYFCDYIGIEGHDQGALQNENILF